MNLPHRLREQIDACRSGSDDLKLPALAELAKEVQRDAAVASELARAGQFDSQVRTALHDLPVPPELAQRLLAAAAASPATAEVSVPAASADFPVARPSRLRLSRRQWIIAGGSLAMVGLLVVGGYQWMRPQRSVVAVEIAAQVDGWIVRLSPKAWQPITRLPPTVVIDSAVSAKRQQWQNVLSANPSGWYTNVTAIDLTAGAGQPRAFLFVVKSSAKFSVPTRPDASIRLTLSGGFNGTAWQRQGSNLLFVLVVEKQPLETYLPKQQLS